MKYLPRDVADGKMRAMAQGAAVMRREVGDTMRVQSHDPHQRDIRRRL